MVLSKVGLTSSQWTLEDLTCERVRSGDPLRLSHPDPHRASSTLRIFEKVPDFGQFNLLEVVDKGRVGGYGRFRGGHCNHSTLVKKVPGLDLSVFGE